MKVLTEAQRAVMLANGRKQAQAQAQGEGLDFPPVVKLFNPCGAATWLLSELDPENPDIAFGLCDLGMGCPELGSVSLSEMASYRGRVGLGIERDYHFTARAPISEYASEARKAERIVEHW